MGSEYLKKKSNETCIFAHIQKTLFKHKTWHIFKNAYTIKMTAKILKFL
jgi:hypothetical protein